MGNTVQLLISGSKCIKDCCQRLRRRAVSVVVWEETGIRPEKIGGMTGFDVNINGKTYISHSFFLQA